MITIWEDAPEPIEYRAKRCSCAFIFKFLSPIILILLTCWFVLMTYYIAPTTISTSDTPTLERPQYYLISSIVDQTGDGGNRFSYLGCNFPAFQRRSIIPLYEEPVYKYSVDPYNRVNITFDVPFDSIIDTEIIIPLGLHFNYHSKPAIFSYISFRITGDSTQNQFSYSGNLKLQQNGDLVQTAASLTEYLDAVDPVNYLDVFSIDDVVNHFSSSPIKLQFISPRIQKINSPDVTAAHTIFNIQFTVPSMVVNMPAPYWNVFRNTYVQLFYWCWVLMAIFRPFVQAAYQYGIIPTTQRKLLNPYTKPKTD